MEPGIILLLAVLAVVAVLVVMIAVSRLLLIAQPNEVIVLSGRKRSMAGGETVGYRMIRGGRAVRIPLLEKASRMSLETIPIDLAVTNAYSKGGIPLKVEAIANIKVDSTEPTFGNAVERFLNRTIEDIHAIAKDTLEGNLRGVLASLTPEEVNEDRLKFAENLIDEALNDLSQLGLKLDTLKITNISDERGYLDSIGRKISAEVIASARKAEAEKKAEAEEAEAESLRRANVARAVSNQNIQSAEIESNRHIAVARAKAEQDVEVQKNFLRIKKAELEREAIIKEKEAMVAGQKAQVIFEQEVEEERILLQKKRLTADVIEPANARKQAMELEAKGAAASVIENGNAHVEVIKLMIQAYLTANGNGDRVFMLNMLPQLTEILASTVRNVNIDKISVIDQGGATGTNGSGGNISKLVTQLPTAVVSLAEMIENATGINIFSQLKKAGTKDMDIMSSFAEKEIKEIKENIINEEKKDA